MDKLAAPTALTRGYDDLLPASSVIRKTDPASSLRLLTLFVDVIVLEIPEFFKIRLKFKSLLGCLSVLRVVDLMDVQDLLPQFDDIALAQQMSW